MKDTQKYAHRIFIKSTILCGEQLSESTPLDLFGSLNRKIWKNTYFSFFSRPPPPRVANTAYMNIVNGGGDQSILITYEFIRFKLIFTIKKNIYLNSRWILFFFRCSGESGAGKTENTKKLIQYFTVIAGQTQQAGANEDGLCLTKLNLNFFVTFRCRSITRRADSWNESRTRGVRQCKNTEKRQLFAICKLKKIIIKFFSLFKKRKKYRVNSFAWNWVLRVGCSALTSKRTCWKSHVSSHRITTNEVFTYSISSCPKD
jgi:hypothetical protein